MSSDPIIDVRHVSKHYPIYARPADRLLQMFARGRRRYYREFRALDDVSFAVERGQTLGVIGRNGAGKSTLLQIVCGTLAPTSGTVQVNGRIAALLELGTGFNPEFSGRDNLAINAAILGLSPAQIAERTDDILAFADIGEFIDQPVKTYSSGMYVRLAFSVAIHVSPDILIVDEALAVGDAFFQTKCMQRMKRMLDDGVTMLFISHDIAAVKALCRQVLWLERGTVRAHGPTTEVAALYTQDWVAQANRQAQAGASDEARAVAQAARAAASDEGASGEGASVSGEGTAVSDAGAPASGACVSEPRAAGVGVPVAASPGTAQTRTTPIPADHPGRSGDGRARIAAAGWSTAQGPARHVPVAWGETLSIDVDVQVHAPCTRLVVSYHVKDRHQQHLLGGHSADAADVYGRAWQPGERLRLRFSLPVRLHEGAYSLTLLVASIGDLQRYTDAVFLDWVDDVTVMQVAPRDRFPLSDLVELEHELAVEVVPAPAAGVVDPR
ncbi:MAG TPA: ABC transporter ATP-binding protein [Quisquiliibacterium sp.]|nr:ABC transporter ATP-binding protein [Quisquiliibacterium sp.]